MLLDQIANLAKVLHEERERREARFHELQMRPNDTIESDNYAFHYFYAAKARSIWDHGLKSVNDLYASDFSEDFFRPTRVRLEGYPYVWFTNCDYVNAVKMPSFMRHPRRAGRDQWGVGPARVIVSQAGLKLDTDYTPYDTPDRLFHFGKYFTSDKPVPRSKFVRMEWFDLHSARWLELQFPDESLT